MKPEQVEALKGQRTRLADQLQAMLDTPRADRPTKPSALKAWLRELESTQHALAQLDQLVRLLTRVERRPKSERPPAPKRAANPDDGQDLAILARIRKGARAELRVTACIWKGRRTIDVRCWSVFKGSDEFKPTRKGVMIDADKLNALIEALHLAQQHA